MQTWLLRSLFVAAATLLLSGPASSADKPKSIIHVVTLYFKPGTTEADKKKVLDGVDEMGKKIPGIKNVWLKSIKVQGDANGVPLTTAFVMEFVDEAAFKAYENHPAHRAWEKIYFPVRGESRTHDITN
ncbi:MAG: Dabb family protein [Bryobacteraceae bacterium]|nr:Dabb family protein [Bryobacteraceae bacterium]MDW8379131.1 Dabb family protein [Bryobacterales bacterium]